MLEQHITAIKAHLYSKRPSQTHHHDLSFRPILRILLRKPPFITTGRGYSLSYTRKRNHVGRRVRHVDKKDQILGITETDG